MYFYQRKIQKVKMVNFVLLHSKLGSFTATEQKKQNKTKNNNHKNKNKQTKGLSITCTWRRLQSYLQAQLKYFKCNSFVLKSDDHGHN